MVCVCSLPNWFLANKNASFSISKQSTSRRLQDASSNSGFVNEGGAIVVEGLLAENVDMTVRMPC